MLTVLSWVMSAIALIGTLINAERNKWGFIFWLISNLYMCIKFFVLGAYAESLLFFVYFLLAIRGIVSWTKKENSEDSNSDEIKATEVI